MSPPLWRGDIYSAHTHGPHKELDRGKLQDTHGKELRSSKDVTDLAEPVSRLRGSGILRITGRFSSALHGVKADGSPFVWGTGRK